MAIDSDALAAELGKIFGGLNEINTYRGTTLAARVSDLRTVYSTDPLDILTGLTDAQASTGSSMDTLVQYLTGRVSDTIIKTVNADRKLPTADINSALVEWNRQLRNAADTFNDCPVTATKADVGTPTADYTFVSSVKDANGKAIDFGVPDVYLITVAADADRGGTRWAETLSLVGKEADAFVTDASYPTGVGLATTIIVIDPDTNGGVVTDGTFDDYTAGAFTSWTRFTGTTAADSVRVAGDYRNGSSGFALNLISDGTDVPGVKQTLHIAPSTRYAVYFAVKAIDATLTTAKVHVSLRRADTDAIVADAFGTNCTVSSSTLATIGVGSWAKFSAVFVSPQYIPEAGLYLDIRLADGTTVTTPATANTAVYVDHVSVQPLDPLYTGGLCLAVFSGIVQPLLTDQWTLTVALAAGSMSSYMIRWLDRTIGLAGRDFLLPTLAGGSETLADSLIG